MWISVRKLLVTGARRGVVQSLFLISFKFVHRISQYWLNTEVAGFIISSVKVPRKWTHFRGMRIPMDFSRCALFDATTHTASQMMFIQAISNLVISFDKIFVDCLPDFQNRIGKIMRVAWWYSFVYMNVFR